MMQETEHSVEIGGTTLTLRTGKLAKQAGGAVIVQYGETVVLGTATMGRPLSPDADFMPLLVDYEEKFYAAGKIKGSRFQKREGRPSDEAILTARLIDRSIRPLFPEGMINDIQVVTTILSYDGENDPDVAAMVAASAALMVSDVPFNGPLAAIRVGLVDGNFVANPTEEERTQSQLDLIVAGTGDRIAMIEAGADELPEDKMLEAFQFAQEQLGLICPAMEALAEEIGKDKQEPTLQQRDDEAIQRVKELARPIFEPKLEAGNTKETIGNAERETYAEMVEHLTDGEGELEIPERVIREAIHELHAEMFRSWVLEQEKRGDGRGMDELRDLHAEVGLLPRTHGSGLFQRGETQILTLATLGGPGDAQIIDTMEVDEKKNYIHYYNFPAFSVGETKPNRGPGRREIGHGALAERALLPVLPDAQDWPYTMLLVSEVLESHGSSSMASACGSSLALMHAGVPIKRPVAGIAMGLVSDGVENFRVLTDIAGIEDEKGDMDFKVAGTTEGITALQMDIKIAGVTQEILSAGFEQAKKARLEILEAMNKAISEPNKEMSPYAPRIEVVMIPVDKIGDLIGPKGKNINEIIEETGAEIDIADDGTVAITSNDGEAMEKALQRVKDATREIAAGERFEGTVVKLMDFGAFVELIPGVDGMVHISQFREERVNDINEVVKVGDTLPVVVTEIDSMGRINLSHKAAMGGTTEPSEANERKPRFNNKPKGNFSGPPAPQI